jgi:hypothetical protein
MQISVSQVDLSASLQSPVATAASARSAALSATAANADARAQRQLTGMQRGLRLFLGEQRAAFNVAQAEARRIGQHDAHVAATAEQKRAHAAGIALSPRAEGIKSVPPPESALRSPRPSVRGSPALALAAMAAAAAKSTLGGAESQ